MSQWRVLHITDFHIENPRGTDEQLREARYDEYLGELSELIVAEREGVDCAVVTGDFVHQGRVDNFDHAGLVLEHLASSLKLPTSRIIVCPGNHDLQLEKNSGDCWLETPTCRDAYRAFAKRFGPIDSSAITIGERARVALVTESIHCLVLDSTLGGRANEPGDLPTAEIDDILREVKKVAPDQLLVVASHYPPVLPSNSLNDFIDEDPDYDRRHEWKAAKALLERIKKQRARDAGRTLWLSGDIHAAEQVCLKRGQFLVTTGRLGTATPRGDSQLRRQARLLLIDREDRACEVVTFNHEPQGHRENSNLGSWQSARGPFRYEAHEDQAEVVVVDNRDGMIARAVLDVTAELPSAAPQIMALNTDLEAEILEVVRREGLYRLGRYETSPAEVSLAWVAVGALLNHEGILSTWLLHSAEWLEQQLAKRGLPAGKVALIGMDCWGGALAAQLSSVTGISNWCLEVRSRGRFCTEFEAIDDQIRKEQSKWGLIILVNEVVGTGSSLRWVYDEFRSSGYEDWASRRTWVSLSVLCDGEGRRSTDLSFLAEMRAGCTALRMPLIDRRLLPDTGILPADLTFQEPPSP